MKATRTLLTSLVILSAWASMNETSFAQTVPFKASGIGAEYNTETGETSGPGQATHMGRILGAGVAIPGDPVDVVNSPGLFYWDAMGDPLPGAIWTYSWTLDGEIDLGLKN